MTFFVTFHWLMKGWEAPKTPYFPKGGGANIDFQNHFYTLSRNRMKFAFQRYMIRPFLKTFIFKWSVQCPENPLWAGPPKNILKGSEKLSPYDFLLDRTLTHQCYAIIFQNKEDLNKNVKSGCLLVQLVPSPLKPSLQAQLNDPTASVQTALLSQSFNSESAHSSISKEEN